MARIADEPDMWWWFLLAGLAVAATVMMVLARRRAEPDTDLEDFFGRIGEEIEQAGDEYAVCGIVPGTMTMVVAVRGQEVPVPMENVFRHDQMFPNQTDVIVRQLLDEIEEVGLEQPSDRMFSDAAMQILPQICHRDWIYDNAPAFGDGAIVHRELGPDLVVCYVIDDPWSIVFVCNAHLRSWGRTEDDLFHLANQNLRRKSGMPLPSLDEGPVRVQAGDGYDAARILMLDEQADADLVVAMPAREALYIGRASDTDELASLMRTDAMGPAESEHPLSTAFYRMDEGQLVPVSAPDLG